MALLLRVGDPLHRLDRAPPIPKYRFCDRELAEHPARGVEGRRRDLETLQRRLGGAPFECQLSRQRPRLAVVRRPLQVGVEHAARLGGAPLDVQDPRELARAAGMLGIEREDPAQRRLGPGEIPHGLEGARAAEARGRAGDPGLDGGLGPFAMKIEKPTIFGEGPRVVGEALEDERAHEVKIGSPPGDRPPFVGESEGRLGISRVELEERQERRHLGGVDLRSPLGRGHCHQ